MVMRCDHLRFFEVMLALWVENASVEEDKRMYNDYESNDVTSVVSLRRPTCLCGAWKGQTSLGFQKLITDNEIS